MTRWRVLATLSVAQFVMVLDTTVMNVSISQIVDDLDTDVATLQMVITFYTLVMAAFMLIGGKLCDIYGRRNVFRIGSLVYGVGSLITGLSLSAWMLLIGWSFIEGLGAIMTIPAIAALVATNYTGRDRVTAFAVIGAISGAAAAAGPLIGGAVTTYASWRYVFLAETAVMAVVLLVSGQLRDAPERSNERIDALSAVLSIGGMFLLVFGMLQSKSWGWLTPRAKPEILGIEVAPMGVSLVAYLIIAGVATLALFIVRQRQLESAGRNRLLRMTLLSIAPLRSGLAVIFGQQLVVASVFFLIPIYLQLTLGLDALETGMRILPLSVALIIASMAGARLVGTLSPRGIVMAGQVTLAAGVLILVGALSPELLGVRMAIAMALTGTGLGLIASQTGNVNMSAVTERDTGAVGGLQGVAQNIGASFGTALIGSILIGSLTTTFVTRVQTSDLPNPVAQYVTANTEAGVEVVSAEDVNDFARAQGLPPDQADLLASLYEDSQLDALRGAVFIIAGLAILAVPLSLGIPGKAARSA